MKTINAFQLKCIAIVAMLINHIGHAFEHQYLHPLWQFFYLFIGLLTFPIMAYLLVEGFYYTKNRLHYLGRLALFWVVSILPFHYALNSEKVAINPVNNIFFTLMMGLLLLMLCEKLPDPTGHILLCLLFILLTLVSDWNVFGIPLIFSFYKNRGYSKGINRTIFLLMLFMMLLSYPSQFVLTSPDTIRFFSRLGLLLLIPLFSHYKGERGYSPSWVKWGFYLFYPLHLLVLFAIRYYIFGY
ncbi:TraX family protein [Streptococcus cameli]